MPKMGVFTVVALLAATSVLNDVGNAAGVVSFKDAAKIKTWDAWNDHKGPQAWKEKPCVT